MEFERSDYLFVCIYFKCLTNIAYCIIYDYLFNKIMNMLL